MKIEIDGLIGVPEWWSFEGGEERAATYERFRQQVERIGRSGARKIEVKIRSIGGNVQDAFLIYDALCALAEEGAEITTVCYGYTASAATIVAQAATSGRRYVASTALYLIHNATTTLDGNAFDAERTARLLDKTDERMAQIYARRSGRSVEEFRERMARDGGRGEWLSPEEAVEAGLADRVGGVTAWGELRERAAERIRNWFISEKNAQKEEKMTISDGCAVVAALAARGGEEGDLRGRIGRSETAPSEDPGVAVSGLIEEDFTEFSHNGRAYHLDASRLRKSF
ncbi:ATP-dependent Clp protease proteolytic subunit [uncultured Rikenella sp.]|uniref:Clp protease ClpP n=1 Tax=uncultured Rikenella sp. TaxID=368003 RepID=UPI00260A3D1C|nr:Clp protease ClpP [uncultured Rikenella sp.]